MPLPVPNAPSELTVSWLTEVLRSGGTLSQAAITDMETEVIGQEWGFTGVVARVRPRYNLVEPSAPRSLIAKFPNAARESQSTYSRTQTREPQALRRHYERCVREIHFYSKIASGSPTPAPGTYFGGADVEAGRFVLLLEDLAPARVGDALAGCSPDEAEAVVREVAPFHAQWWNHPRLETLGWLPLWSRDPSTAQSRLAANVSEFLAKFEQRLPAWLVRLITALPESYAKLLEHLNSPPFTLLHADLHLDNIVFHPPGSSRQVTVVDWQGAARGRCAVDVGLFLASSLSIEDRRRAEHHLLGLYHSLLLASGVSGYALDELFLDCRLSLLWQLGGTVNWLATADFDALAGRERALVEAVLDEGLLFAALLDHDAAALLPL